MYINAFFMWEDFSHFYATLAAYLWGRFGWSVCWSAHNYDEILFIGK